jgi:hypothetical protein
LSKNTSDGKYRRSSPQRALDGDGLKGELPDAGRHIAAAPFAGDHELSPLDDWEPKGHCHSIGKIKAKMFTARSALLASI